jgi:hypothetical protein
VLLRPRLPRPPLPVQVQRLPPAAVSKVSIYLFFFLFFLGGGGLATLLTRMTGISLHMHWPLISQSHGSVSQREQLV